MSGLTIGNRGRSDSGGGSPLVPSSPIVPSSASAASIGKEPPRDGPSLELIKAAQSSKLNLEPLRLGPDSDGYFGFSITPASILTKIIVTKYGAGRAGI